MALERNEITWLIEQLKRASELEGSLGFIWNYKGKTSTHLLEISFNNSGRFIEITKFITNRITRTLLIPEDDKSKGWETLRKTISSMLNLLLVLL